MDNQVSQTAFGETLGVHQSVVSHYLRGEYKPSRVRANAIALATTGAVPSLYWEAKATPQELRDLAASMSVLRLAGSGVHDWPERAASKPKKRAASKGRQARP